MSDLAVTSSTEQQLSKEQLELLRTRGKESLFFFAKAILGYSKLSKRVHGPICAILEDRTKVRARFVLPRGWFKTTLITIAYPIWRAINDPNVRILVAQNTVTNAKAKLASISKHFSNNVLFRALYPEILPDKQCVWNTESMTVRRTASWPEGTFEAAGAKTQVTGRHYDEIIEDDTVAPDKDEISTENILPTKDDIDQAIGWHRLATPILTPEPLARIIVVGTRWFEIDLLSWIADNEKWYFSYTRAARETDGHPDPEGEPAFPEVYGEAKLKETEASMGPYMFACLYMNTPTRTSEMLFQPEWFTNWYDTEPQNCMCWTTVDPGNDPEDTKGKPDYNVVMTCGKDLITGRVYVLDYTRRRCGPSETIEIIFDHVRRFRPVKVAVEAIAYQLSLLHWIKEKKRGHNLYFTVEAIRDNRRSKNMRIMGLQPLFSAGRIFLRPHMKELVTEALAFPNGANDDIIDALAMQLEMWTLTKSKVEQAAEIVEHDPRNFDQVIEEFELKRRSVGNDPIHDMLFEDQSDLAPWSVFN